MLTRRRPIDVRFWEKVKKADGDACWEWTGAVDRDGYEARSRLAGQAFARELLRAMRER